MNKNVTVKQVLLKVVCVYGILFFVGCNDTTKKNSLDSRDENIVTESKPVKDRFENKITSPDNKEILPDREPQKFVTASPILSSKSQGASVPTFVEDDYSYRETDSHTSNDYLSKDEGNTLLNSEFASFDSRNNNYSDYSYYESDPGYYYEDNISYIDNYYFYSYNNYYFPSYVTGGERISPDNSHTNSKRPVDRGGNAVNNPSKNGSGGRLSNPIERESVREPKRSGKENEVPGSDVSTNVSSRTTGRISSVSNAQSSSTPGRGQGRISNSGENVRSSESNSERITEDRSSVERERQEQIRKDNQIAEENRRNEERKRQETAARYQRENEERKFREEQEVRERRQREDQERKDRENRARKEQEEREAASRRQAEEQERRDREDKEKREQEQRAADARRQREEQERRDRQEQERKEREQRETESRRQREESERRNREAERTRQQDESVRSQSQSRTVNRSQESGRSGSSDNSGRSGSSGRSGRR